MVTGFARLGGRAVGFLANQPLRLGGMIGDGAVVDASFNTVDVCLVLPAKCVEARYQRHFAQTRVRMPMAA